MAVYTVLSREEIEQLIEPFGIGPLVNYEGVAAGIENTNYFISTDQSTFASELYVEPIRHFVLTIFESASEQDLVFYDSLTTLLNLKGLPVPCPLKDADGQALQHYQNKPVMVTPKINGEHPEKPNIGQCKAIGHALANIHLACLESGLSHESIRSLSWLQQTAESLLDKVPSEDRALLSELGPLLSRINQYNGLPQAVIHGDLFKDNALFDGNQLTGVIDFNSAGNGYLMLDLAIVVNDWCFSENGQLTEEMALQLLEAYQSVRTFTEDERTLWPDFLKLAAFRFWVSRLSNQINPDSEHSSGVLVEQKDPSIYKNILMRHINDSSSL